MNTNILLYNFTAGFCDISTVSIYFGYTKYWDAVNHDYMTQLYMSDKHDKAHHIIIIIILHFGDIGNSHFLDFVFYNGQNFIYTWNKKTTYIGIYIC